MDDRFNVLEPLIRLPVAEVDEAVLHVTPQVVRRAMVHPGIETVDPDHRVAAIAQGVDDVRSDESGGAGDEHLHRAAPPVDTNSAVDTSSAVGVSIGSRRSRCSWNHATVRANPVCSSMAGARPRMLRALELSA